jgi:hypothetical protein
MLKRTTNPGQLLPYPFLTVRKLCGKLYVEDFETFNSREPTDEEKILIFEGKYVNYNTYNEHDRELVDDKPNLVCDCGNTEFEVCYWDKEFCGCFIKLYCKKCGEEFVLFNDYA